MLNKLPPAVCLRGGGGTGLLNKGGGSNRLPVEFPQVQTSSIIIVEDPCRCLGRSILINDRQVRCDHVPKADIH